MLNAPHPISQRLAVAGVHDHLVDLVGALDGPGLEHPRHDDAVESLADPIELLDRHAEIAHLLPERDRVPLERREVAQPREQDLHDSAPWARQATSGLRRGAWGAEAPPEPPTRERPAPPDASSQ